MPIVRRSRRCRLVYGGNDALVRTGLALARISANVGGKEQNREGSDFRNEVEEEEVHRAMDDDDDEEREVRSVEMRSNEMHAAIRRSAAK